METTVTTTTRKPKFIRISAEEPQLHPFTPCDTDDDEDFYTCIHCGCPPLNVRHRRVADREDRVIILMPEITADLFSVAPSVVLRWPTNTKLVAALLRQHVEASQ
jgi:hypothetical protein